MSRLLFLFFLSLVTLGIPSFVHASPPDEIIEDAEEIEDDEALEDDDINDWDADIEEDYVPVGENGPISLIETPSIIDSGIYTNVIEIDMEDVEEHGHTAVTIPK